MRTYEHNILISMKKAELVVKSNRLIEASYRLSLNEQRIILYAICQCRRGGNGLFPDLPITITADEFMRQFPSVEKGSVYGQLKEAMNALYSRSVTIYDTDPITDKDRVKETRWISEKAYIDGAGHIQVVFAPEVIKYITRLETEFTSYQLEKVGRMTSVHAVRMYELLAQYKDIGSRTLSLMWLRNALQIGPGEYKLTADFKKWVLDTSVEQINKHGDITVNYKPKKTGRAITDFVFKIKEKERKPKATANDQTMREKLEMEHGQQRIPEDNGEF
jgi:plasmid replication initiation protein